MLDLQAGDTQVTYEIVLPDWPDPNNQELPIAMFTEGVVIDVAGLPTDIPDSMAAHGGVAALQDGVYPDASYAGTQDAHVIVHSDGNNNTGAWTEIEEGHWGEPLGDHKKILIQFDMTPLAGSVPSSAVNEAWLMLYYQRHRSAGSPDHRLFTQRILKPWIEGTGGGGIDGADVAQDGEVTWNDAAHNQVPWTLPGLMSTSDVLSVNPDNRCTSFGSTTGVWVSLRVTEDVVYFLDNPSENHGWKVSQDGVLNYHAGGFATISGLYVGGVAPAGNEYVTPANVGDGAAFDFWSSEAPVPELRPALIIWTSAAVPVEVSKFYLY
jgi:hypothetical protein